MGVRGERLIADQTLDPPWEGKSSPSREPRGPTARESEP